MFSVLGSSSEGKESSQSNLFKAVRPNFFPSENLDMLTARILLSDYTASNIGLQLRNVKETDSWKKEFQG